MIDKECKRLASPKGYRGDAAVTQAVTGHLNQILQVEGLELALVGVEPQIRERKAAASVLIRGNHRAALFGLIGARASRVPLAPKPSMATPIAI